MRLVCIFILFFIYINVPLKGQSIFNELKSIEKKAKTNEKYAIVKFSNEEMNSFDEEKKRRFSYFEGGVLFIPSPIRRKIQDTITFELEYNFDSTTCTNRNVHSYSFENVLIIVPSVAEGNCLGVDTVKGNKIYQIKFIEIENNPINIAVTSRFTCENWEGEIEKETIIQENTILVQPEFKWLLLEEWSSKGKIKVETGIMDAVFRDENGDYYILFEAGYYSEIRQVLCSIRFGSSFLIMDLQKELLKRGYAVELNNEFDGETKAAITKFQKDNNLPSGHFNMKTLRALGIKY